MKFFNNLKEEIRNELTRAREFLAGFMKANPGAKDDARISPEVLPKEIEFNYLNSQTVTSRVDDIPRDLKIVTDRDEDGSPD